MRFIAELLNQTSESILDYLNELPNRPEGLVCQPFRLKKGEPLMFVMFYYHKETNTVALVGIERHERNHIDYLADESPFNGEEVLYFSESDHYTSPLLRPAEGCGGGFEETLSSDECVGDAGDECEHHQQGRDGG